MCARSIRQRAREAAHWRLLTTHKLEDFEAAQRIVGFYRKRWTIEQLFRTMKTKGFQIEALRQQEGPLQKLVTAILIAAIVTMQLVAERDGVACRPLEDALDPEDGPCSNRSARALKETPKNRRTRTLKAPSPTRPGSSQGSAAGPDTTENPVQSSCSGGSRSSKQSNMDANSAMCESRSPWGEGQGEGSEL